MARAITLCASGATAAERAPDMMQGDRRVSAFCAWDAAADRVLAGEAVTPVCAPEDE